MSSSTFTFHVATDPFDPEETRFPELIKECDPSASDDYMTVPATPAGLSRIGIYFYKLMQHLQPESGATVESLLESVRHLLLNGAYDVRPEDAPSEELVESAISIVRTQLA